jgi:hypothetical protein
MDETNPPATTPPESPVEVTGPPALEATAAPSMTVNVGINKPRIGGGSDDTAWVGGSNVKASQRSRPSSTLARRPTDFKSASQIEQKAAEGLSADRCLGLDGKTSKITMTSWKSATQEYMEEHGLDTVFRIYDPIQDTEAHLLQEWGKAEPDAVEAWEDSLAAGVGNSPLCDFDLDNLKWSGKALMRSIALDLWETVEKDIGIGANGPRTFTAVISKIQQVSASSTRTMVDKLRKMNLKDEPGQHVDNFGSKVIELCKRIAGTGFGPKDLNSIVAGCFLDCDVQLFQLTALNLHNQVDDNPNSIDWETIVRRLKTKFTSPEGMELWEPLKNQEAKKEAESSVLDGLVASINKLTAQADRSRGGGGGGGPTTCWICQEEGHVRSDCPNWHQGGNRAAPGAGQPTTKIVGGVSQTYCAKCRRWTKGAKEHTTAAHRSNRGAPAPPAAGSATPAPVVAPVGAIGAIGSLLPAGEVVQYTGGRLTFNGGLFVGGITGVNPEGEPTPNPQVPFEDPSICPNDLFFSNTYRRNQGPEEYHDASAATQEEAAPAAAPPYLPSEDNDNWSVSSASDDEPPPGQCPNCRQHGWLANLCDTCQDSGFIFEPIPDDAVFESGDEDPSDADDPPGRCPNCRQYGSLATLCGTCEDSGFIFEPVESGDEEPNDAEDESEDWSNAESELKNFDGATRTEHPDWSRIFEGPGKPAEVANGTNVATGKGSSKATSTPSMYWCVCSCLCWTIVLAAYVAPIPMVGYILLLFSPFLGWTSLPQPLTQKDGPHLLKLKKIPYARSLLFAFPACYVLLSTCMLSASFVSFLLLISGLLSCMLAVSPWSNKIFSVPAPKAPPGTFDACNDPKQFLPKRSKLAPGQRLLRLGLLAAISMADSMPHVDLIQDKTFKRSLRSHRASHGFFITANLKTAAIERLRVILDASKVHLLRSEDYFELIMDSGCSKICIGHETDFIPGSLEPLKAPLSMDGIAGMLTSHHKGLVRYEIINDAGGLSVIECEAYLLPSLKFRLFSPQVFLQEANECEGMYQLRWDGSWLDLANGDKITIGYHQQTALPVLRAFSNAMKTAQSLASVVSDSNENLTSHQRKLFHWHARWGHLGLQHCQWIGRTGILGATGIKMGSTTVTPPKCASCQLGKQERTPKAGTKSVTKQDGFLKLNKLEPGTSFSRISTNRASKAATSPTGVTLSLPKSSVVALSSATPPAAKSQLFTKSVLLAVRWFKPSSPSKRKLHPLASVCVTTALITESTLAKNLVPSFLAKAKASSTAGLVGIITTPWPRTVSRPSCVPLAL